MKHPGSFTKLTEKKGFVMKKCIIIKWVDKNGVPSSIYTDSFKHAVSDCKDLLTDGVDFTVTYQDDMPESFRKKSVNDAVHGSLEYYLNELENTLKDNENSGYSNTPEGLKALKEYRNKVAYYRKKIKQYSGK